MIQYIEGDLFKSPAKVIVNTVNTVGVMGKGIALEFKQRYPEMFLEYCKACDKKQLVPGKLMIHYAPDHWILLFPTKENWRNPSKIEYIEKGLQKFVNTYAELGITSIAFPLLGCGNGELDWEKVKPVMERYLNPLPIDVYVYLNNKNADNIEHKHIKETLDWLRAHAKDMSFNGVVDDIKYSCDITGKYRFRYLNEEWEVAWDDGLSFSQNGPVLLKVSNDAFEHQWYEIHNKAIFPVDSDDLSMNLTYSMLATLGYLSEVIIVSNKADANSRIPGYQFNEGPGRIYALKG